MKHREAELLLEKYNKGTISPKELEILEAWYRERMEAGSTDISDEELEENLDSVWRKLNTVSNPPKVVLWKRIVAAAAAILLVVTIAWLLYQHNLSTPINQTAVDNKIVPGGNRAFLTLSNGKKLSLADAGNGTLANDAGVVISQSADGQLLYTVSDNRLGTGKLSDQYNTIETPRGGQFQVILPDGTHVWLNAASVLKYPVRFSKTERTVELLGEAYFQVAKDPAKPFILQTLDQKISVLGTHFNVNGYPEDKLHKTTLLEGAIRVSSKNGEHPLLLKPGQEYESGHEKAKVRQVDTQESVAWKNGEFVFTDESLESIMNKIARWYDVSVSYEQVDPATRFGGAVSRFSEISKVLEKLELTGEVRFRINGRRIIVTK
ncbi:MAG: DUF4974 domain-containing protein [Sphingobacterium sp.]|jgi:ferric-dicitrate binding protein FerR (iron transport regulator)|nr:DUF4974 domain-containing protein [Sphingobacterium sp.]